MATMKQILLAEEASKEQMNQGKVIEQIHSMIDNSTDFIEEKGDIWYNDVKALSRISEMLEGCIHDIIDIKPEIDNEKAIITLKIPVIESLPAIPFLFPDIVIEKEYEVRYLDQHWGTIFWEKAEGEHTIGYETFYIPAKPAEFITLEFKIDGGEKQDDGEIRS